LAAERTSISQRCSLARHSGRLQRRLDLPDATVLVLQGVAFIVSIAGVSGNGQRELVEALIGQRPPSPGPSGWAASRIEPAG
jgi:ABC-type uncharacterized transport system ATPase subunit